MSAKQISKPGGGVYTALQLMPAFDTDGPFFMDQQTIEGVFLLLLAGNILT